MDILEISFVFTQAVKVDIAPSGRNCITSQDTGTLNHATNTMPIS